MTVIMLVLTLTEHNRVQKQLCDHHYYARVFFFANNLILI